MLAKDLEEGGIEVFILLFRDGTRNRPFPRHVSSFSFFFFPPSFHGLESFCSVLIEDEEEEEEETLVS